MIGLHPKKYSWKMSNSDTHTYIYIFIYKYIHIIVVIKAKNTLCSPKDKHIIYTNLIKLHMIFFIF